MSLFCVLKRVSALLLVICKEGHLISPVFHWYESTGFIKIATTRASGLSADYLLRDALTSETVA
jgi:hypothetical protein